MPIYAFHCDRCDLDSEVIQSFRDAPPEHCGMPMRLLPSVASSAFVTLGGNLFNFAGAHGRVGRHRSKKPATIGHNHGMGSDKRRAPWKQAPIERLPKVVKP